MFSFGKSEPNRKGQRNEVLPLENKGLPDSYRPCGLCPRCGKQSSFENAGSLPVTFDFETYAIERDGTRSNNQMDRVTSLICRHCKQGVVVVEEEWVGDSPRTKNKFGGVLSYRGIHWWPLPEAQLSPDIPNEISSAFSEAVTSLLANCPRASVVMARRTLEAITADKGEKEGSLDQRLIALSKKGILLPTLSDWAKEVRLVGNSGAHYDPIQPVETKDAQQLIDFIRELLKYLYELPAELSRRRTT
jgi:hypothetical protein